MNGSYSFNVADAAGNTHYISIWPPQDTSDVTYLLKHTIGGQLTTRHFQNATAALLAAAVLANDIVFFKPNTKQIARLTPIFKQACEAQERLWDALAAMEDVLRYEMNLPIAELPDDTLQDTIARESDAKTDPATAAGDLLVLLQTYTLNYEATE